MGRGSGRFPGPTHSRNTRSVGCTPGMKLLIEILISAVLHPLAFVLALINIAGRADLSALQKVLWAIVSLVWGIGPILYILLGGGDLW